MKTNSGSCAPSWTSIWASSTPCLLPVIFLLLSSGCSTVRVLPEDLPPIPPSLLQECRLPLALPDGRPATVSRILLQDSEDLLDCRERHKALVEVVKFRDQLLNSHKE